MSEEFVIKPEVGRAARAVLNSQFFSTPPYPTKSFAQETVIVTGSNTGLGLEAARHFYRLDCAKLIMAVRTISKGEMAKEDIVQSVKHRTDGAEAIEVWPLNLASTESTLSFGDRVNAELSRVDVFVGNAGINNQHWATSEEYEESIQVNVINTLLVALLVLPKLARTKEKIANSNPHLTIVTSALHLLAKFKEVSSPAIYPALNDERAFNGNDRYNVTKLMEILFVRELVSRLDGPEPPLATITLVNPGFCVSGLNHSTGPIFRIFAFILEKLVARSSEVGARMLIHGASAPMDSHGHFMSDGKNEEVASWIYSEMGKAVQSKVFVQTMSILESRRPGIGKDLGIGI